jgi:hypothetical protein
LKKKVRNTNIISNLSIDNSENLITALESLLEVYKKRDGKELLISTSIFSAKLGILEALVKYLKENLALKYHEIADLLNRDDRTIWATYQKAIRKQEKRFLLNEESYDVPISLFSDRIFGPLEALVIYLKEEHNLSFNEISQLLKRSYRTIWLSYNNAIKKEGYNGNKR